jgi:hypothetical protein
MMRALFERGVRCLMDCFFFFFFSCLQYDVQPSENPGYISLFFEVT